MAVKLLAVFYQAFSAAVASEYSRTILINKEEVLLGGCLIRVAGHLVKLRLAELRYKINMSLK